MDEVNTWRCHLNDGCNEKIINLIRELNKGYPYVMICIPKYLDEEIFAVKDGERLGSDVDLEKISSEILSGETQARAQFTTEIVVSRIGRAVLQLDDAVCSWERATSREYTFMLVAKINQKWVIYASQSGKPTFPSDFDWGEILKFGLNLRANS